jgi:hypothetical protein
MAYHRVCDYINTTGATSGVGSVNPSEAREFIHDFSGVSVTRSFVLYVYFVNRCLSFCIFFVVFVLSVLLRFSDYDYTFSIF